MARIFNFSLKELFEELLKPSKKIVEPAEIELPEVKQFPTKIKDALETGLVEFWYRKVDDKTLRKASGTRDRKLLPFLYGFKAPSGDGKVSPSVIVYWDTDRQDWRCFRESNFVKLEDWVPTSEIIE